MASADRASDDARFPRLLQRFDHHDPEFEAHVFEVANELRERCPVAHSDAQGGFWTFTRFEDVQQGFADGERFSTTPTVTIPVNPGAVPLIPLQCEPGVHRDFRRILDPYFRAGAVAKYEAGIRQITTELIDGFVEQGRCEFVSDFARPLPSAAIFRLFLGLPESEVDEAYRWTTAIRHALGTPEAEQVHPNFMNLIGRMLERRRAEPPRDDVVDALLHATVSGRPMTADEVARTVLQLVAAGLNTTALALGSMVVTLARRPELGDQLRAAPELIPRAIEELLRWEPPSGGLVRTAVADVEVGGQHVRAGDHILLLVAAANRDPEEFEAPDEIRFDRPQLRHLSFGYGAHYCIGAHLARLELRVALEELLGRLTHIRIVDPHVRYDSGCSRGPLELNIEFTPAPKSSSSRPSERP